MCPPHHYGVVYEINPWMHRGAEIDTDVALEEWQHLHGTLQAAGAGVALLDPRPHVPDLVFTANAGLVNGGQFVPSRFRHPERQPETPIDAAWFAEQGWLIDWLSEGLCHEGAGDAVPFTPERRGVVGPTVLLSGHPFRSDLVAARRLVALTGCAVAPIRLIDPRLYHLDLTFCPLDHRRAIVAPTAWDVASCKVVRRLVPEALVLDEAEALKFCANSVVIGRTVVMPTVPVRVGRQLERWRFTPVECQVGEFVKAGGGCRCLTLALDVTLSSSQGTPPTAPGVDHVARLADALLS
jgi:N-dimethylarginine dimethylaminohydrolase